MAAFGSLKQRIFDKEARKQQYQAYVRGLNAYDRHKKFLDDYAGFYGKESSTQEKLPIKTDQDTLREGYRFIRSEEDDMNPSWEQRLVKRYYDKLFKECCIKLRDSITCLLSISCLGSLVGGGTTPVPERECLRLRWSSSKCCL